MAALTAGVPDKVEILALVESALAWDLNGGILPTGNDALRMAEQFADYGRIVADDLRTLVLSIPADSDVAIRAQATLSEASRRLPLPPPPDTPRAAGRRAQNLARLVQGLCRAAGRITEEQARTVRRTPQQATQKGTLE
ncbi:DUF6415 family natural product biosynthesis protein [Streptomyces sp. JV176]|uniref:DUF6415 family natural product biosynthesis protein n=1 Tax=Streptomyces sp. JV176 TaxID=858630 RepID=UPI002E796053|nr:DUF6415 family natural product biosynthesis protein [Streptomyces sp. JV176]MEE1797521.1 DUF6415 family natural product biosynthesis protein [Streptomyces sp. JV176]